MLRRARADGQGKTISVNNVPIDEKSKARPFVEAFIPELVDDLVKFMEEQESENQQ